MNEGRKEEKRGRRKESEGKEEKAYRKVCSVKNITKEDLREKRMKRVGKDMSTKNKEKREEGEWMDNTGRKRKVKKKMQQEC